MDAEVIVVGAGPAGSATAYHLAHRGRRVLLLDRQAFPRDKSCGDGVTRAATRLLAEMGVIGRLANAQKVRGVRVFMRGKGSRDFEYPRGLGEPDHGLVVQRLHLDNAICQQAVAAGAEFWEKVLVNKLIWSQGIIVGVEIVHQGERKQLHAPVIVAADGAASRLARQAGLVKTSPESLGFAIRGYYTNIEDLTELLEIYTPLMDPSDRYLLPSYGWVFPIGPTSANIGVGLFKREHGVNVRDLFERFLEELRLQDQRFKHTRLYGEWKGASLRFDFAPERCSAPGLLLVGDAAGMISPFTGEGISYALESGKLAAEVIDRNLHPEMTTAPDLSDYAILLEKNYTGYFETGRQSARRYLLVWHLLESTFHNEKPLFALCRRAVLFPEGVGESYVNTMLDDVSPLIPRVGMYVREDLLAIGEVLINIVRKDWPFLTRVYGFGQSDPGIPFRPALLLLLSGYFGNPRDPRLIAIGAAVELGYSAAIAQLSVEEESKKTIPDGARIGNWGNMIALMIGDFLLSKAYEISSQEGSEVALLIAESLSRACEGQVKELLSFGNQGLTVLEYLEILELKTATLSELPCRLGARLSGVSPIEIDALVSYGRNFGMAYQLADISLELVGQDSRLGKESGLGLREGNYWLPVLILLQQDDNFGRQVRTLLRQKKLDEESHKTVLKLIRESKVSDKVLEIAGEYAEQAQKALEVLPDGPARLSLSRLATYAVTREVPEDN